MTFNESEVVRDTAGRFGEKPQSEAEVSLGPAEVSVRDAQARHAALFRESEEAALDFIQTHAPEGAVAAEFEWSDQGEFIELTAFELEDGTRVSVGDVLFGDNEHNQDVDLYDEMSSAARNVESPYARGLNGDERSVELHLTLSERALAGDGSREALERANELARAAQAELETTAVRELRRFIPEGGRMRLEADDELRGLQLVAVFDKDAQVSLSFDDEDRISEVASAIAASPSVAAGSAGLSIPEGFTSSSGVYDLEPDGPLTARA